MLNFSNTTLTSFTLNIVSSIAELLTLFISLCFLFSIIYRFLHIKYHHGQLKIGVPVILSINTLCSLIAKSIIQLIDVSLNALRRDLNPLIEKNDSFFCRLRGYTYFSVVSALYWSIALQAIFHFMRILYPTYLQLHQPAVYLYVLIPGQIIFAFSSVLPNLLIFDAIRLIPDEIYCTVLMNDFPSLIYLFLVVFGLPLGTIMTCYTCIVYEIRYSSSRRFYEQRNRRDYIVIRRIMIIVAILSIASLPAIIDLFVYAPQGRLDPLIYRIEWVSASVNALVFAISLPIINPQLRELLTKRQVHKKRRIIRLQMSKKTIEMEFL